MNKLKAFFYGIISASGATIFQQIVAIVLGLEIIDTSRLTPLLIFLAISEEIFKFIFIYRLCLDEKGQKNIFWDSLFVGFGFSLLELTFKIWGEAENAIDFLRFDYLGIMLIHILTAGIIGFFLARKWPILMKISVGLGIALILHLAYNALVIYIF